MPLMAMLRTGALGLAALAVAGSAVSQSQSQSQAQSQAQAQAGQIKADLELVLAVDISRSMDYEEHELQRDGYVEAFRHKDVINALMSGPQGRIAVTYMEWAGEGATYQVIPWTIIDSSNAAHAFADRLAEEPVRGERRTSISGALFAAADLIERNNIAAFRRAIDVSGDGANNAGVPVEEAREYVLRRDITINGLPILLNEPGGFGNGYDIEHLDRYYKHCVIGGDGAFIAPVYDLKHLAATIRKKLVMEIAGLDIEPDAAPVQFAEVQPASDGPGLTRIQLKLPTEKSDCLAGEKARMRRDGFNFQ
ncbi:MAG TPA: DUF1194 domain-containing protein [Hyphomonadaceae bacterium]|nr:DUF1194 domain-containing protein [Hyphomonadaceae bacterium]